MTAELPHGIVVLYRYDGTCAARGGVAKMVGVRCRPVHAVILGAAAAGAVIDRCLVSWCGIIVMAGVVHRGCS